MTVWDVFARLEPLGDEAPLKRNTKFGAPGDQFGVRHGDIGALAKRIKADQALALKLWDTGTSRRDCRRRSLSGPRGSPRASSTR